MPESTSPEQVAQEVTEINNDPNGGSREAYDSLFAEYSQQVTGSGATQVDSDQFWSEVKDNLPADVLPDLALAWAQTRGKDFSLDGNDRLSREELERITGNGDLSVLRTHGLDRDMAQLLLDRFDAIRNYDQQDRWSGNRSDISHNDIEVGLQRRIDINIERQAQADSLELMRPLLEGEPPLFTTIETAKQRDLSKADDYMTHSDLRRYVENLEHLGQTDSDSYRAARSLADNWDSPQVKRLRGTDEEGLTNGSITPWSLAQAGGLEMIGMPDADGIGILRAAFDRDPRTQQNFAPIDTIDERIIEEEEAAAEEEVAEEEEVAAEEEVAEEEEVAAEEEVAEEEEVAAEEEVAEEEEVAAEEEVAEEEEVAAEEEVAEEEEVAAEEEVAEEEEVAAEEEVAEEEEVAAEEEVAEEEEVAAEEEVAEEEEVAAEEEVAEEEEVVAEEEVAEEAEAAAEEGDSEGEDARQELENQMRVEFSEEIEAIGAVRPGDSYWTIAERILGFDRNNETPDERAARQSAVPIVNEMMKQLQAVSGDRMLHPGQQVPIQDWINGLAQNPDLGAYIQEAMRTRVEEIAERHGVSMG